MDRELLHRRVEECVELTASVRDVATAERARDALDALVCDLVAAGQAPRRRVLRTAVPVADRVPAPGAP